MSKRLSRAVLVVATGLTGISCISAQTVERVDVYMDAVVVTWKSELKAGPCHVARSFHAAAPAELMLFSGSASSPHGALRMEVGQWNSPEAAKRRESLDAALRSAQLELGLKNAQLQLVEEDLALLRANRNVGGTSEALLVEDLVEVAEWMHEETKELLYRRVELHAEVEVAEEALARLEDEWEEAAPREVYDWWVDVPEGTDGPIWVQVLETGRDLHWTPQDVLEVTQATGEPGLKWLRRAEVLVDLPVNAAVPVRFHAARIEGLDVRPDARPQVLEAYDMRKDSKVGYLANEGARPNAGAWPAASWLLEDGQVGAEWNRSIPLEVESLPVTLRHHAVPRQSKVVNLRLAIPRPAGPVDDGERPLLLLDGSPLGKVWLTEQGDSLILDAGAATAWTVEREREAALCAKANLGSRIKHHRAYRISVSNRSSRAGEVVIEEPLPVSRNAEIEVLPESTDGGILDEVTGILRWTLTLAAGETRTLQFSYDLSHDRNVAPPDFD